MRLLCPRRRESVLAHIFRVARDLGITLCAAKMPYLAELLSIGQPTRRPLVKWQSRSD